MSSNFSPFSLLRGIASAAFAAAGSIVGQAVAAPVRGRVVLITGSSSGLGLALAERYATAGAKLVLTARSMDDLTAAKERLLHRGAIREADILLLPCDIAKADDVSSMIHAAIAHFGRVDVLINNAGIIQVGPIESQTVEAFQQAMQTNFFGAVHTVQAVLPHMLARRTGKIVNIASIAGKFAMPHLLPYVASKFALVGYSEGLHAELRHKGIRVTTVCPGLMRTGSQNHAQFSGNARAESRWFTIAATMPLLAASVKRAANRIYMAEHDGRAEITITPQAWLAARFAGAHPEASQIAAAIVNEYLLPNAPYAIAAPSAPAPATPHATASPA
ncbi:MAG: SDR family NAD(P)-dependent oxidoreductase [Edaphobacter sp.]|uniref:SDR family NAD(P)-dependent oxidoreductase n=1 Tax=Edaphobacter sp. TaxID=1934404 RepID=UPI0023A56657|nr:SDR family NAD(P)-dependent oxidoreductase [Edaphobacter sp.]MDE1176751.1 SDR family NAD(P)-dependent oxidoreductase [Edaphobacter sp.]